MTESPAESSAAAEARELIARGSGPNFAATAPDASDPRLRPRTLTLEAEPAAGAVLEAIGRLPRWRVLDRRGLVIRATRTTRLFRFVDDVLVLLETGPGGTQVHVRSASRMGRRDLGQNRRNLAELWRALSVE